MSEIKSKFPNVQWKLDNIADIENLLREHVTSIEQSGDQLRIRGLLGLEIILNPGDCMMRDGDRIGVIRVPDDERVQPVMQTIEVHCEHCHKPITVDIDQLQDPATIWVVCSEVCKTAYEARILAANNGQSIPGSDRKH